MKRLACLALLVFGFGACGGNDLPLQPAYKGNTTVYPVSVEGDSVPPLSQLVDTAGTVWTLDTTTHAIFQNGVINKAADAGGNVFKGGAWKLQMHNQCVYALGFDDSRWWGWISGTWVITVDPNSPVLVVQ